MNDNLILSQINQTYLRHFKLFYENLEIQTQISLQIKVRHNITIPSPRLTLRCVNMKDRKKTIGSNDRALSKNQKAAIFSSNHFRVIAAFLGR